VHSSGSTPDFDPEWVAEEYLALAPSHRPYAPLLIQLARIAWDGSWPGQFYRELAAYLSRLPWLTKNWIDTEVIQALSSPQLPEDSATRWAAWVAPSGTWRQRTLIRQFEGLVILAGRAGCAAAQMQLARALDVIDQGITSDRQGTGQRRRRRHPIKNVLFAFDRPQSMAALAEALSHLIPRIWAHYPKFGKFLVDAIWPLVTDQNSTWSPSTDADDLFGLHLEQGPEGVVATDIPRLDFQPPPLRAFTAADLVEELDVLVQLDESQKIAAAALTPIWRGEDTGEFYESVYRILIVATWLQHPLQQYLNVAALRSISQSIHSTQEIYALGRALKWRERKGIERGPAINRKALVAPSERDRRLGIFHLRGLLILGRFRGILDTNADADQKLSELICELQRGIRRPLTESEIASGIKGRHPLEFVLDCIGKPQSMGDLLSAFRELLPEISAAHPAGARLLDEVYLRLLTDEKPNQPKQSSPRLRRKPRPTIKIRRVRVPTREQIIPGESWEEAQPDVIALRKSEASKPRTTIKEEIQWVHQRVWGSNPLLIRNHIESVSDVEMKLIVQSIESRIMAGLADGHFDSVRIAIVAALIALTGRGPNTFARADSRLSSTHASKAKHRLWLRNGIFELPLVRPEDAFEANEETAHLLEKTVAVISLTLPPKLRWWIDALLDKNSDSWQWKPEDLRAALNAFFADVDEEVCSGVTLARVRNFARARIRAVTKDTSKTMLLCGDTFGLSTASLYYAGVSRVDLERCFEVAMWPVFGDIPSLPPSSRADSERIGSQLLVTAKTARELARSPGAPMNASGKQRVEDRRRVQDHNALTNHVLCMLMAVGGHRPTAALLELGRFDLDLEQSAAIFSDKQCDPVHSYRYTPLADLIAEQVKQYLKHLRSLARAAGYGDPAQRRAGLSLLGDASLFFHLAPDGSPAELNLASWRLTLPANWSALPLNWGRTWLASRGREAGIEADHLAIVLGHLEAAGYPYSRESPLEPSQLSRKVSGPLGSLARSAGWVLRKGMGEGATADELLQEVGPLRDWKHERQEHAAQLRQFQVALNQARRSQLRSKREESERLVRSILREAISTEVPTFDDLAKAATPFAANDAHSDPSRSAIQISLEELGHVERLIEERAGSDKILAIAAHNFLHRYLKRAVERRKWDCPIPSPWLSPPTQEPTPFFPGLFRATTQLHQLRDHFGQIPPRSGSEAMFSDFEWACGIAAMALCIFSFESDPLRVRSILAGRMSMTGSSTINDLLLFETGDRAQSVGARGIAAAALARLRRDHPSDALPEPAKLDEVLAAQIPAGLAGHSTGLLERLCATIEITNRVELSGLARLANDSRSGCVSMPITRQRQFLEEGWGSLDVRTLPSSNPTQSLQIEGQKCKPSEVRRNYHRLRNVLHIGMGPKTFQLTGETLTQANIGAFRGPLLRELEALLSEGGLGPLVACITAYAHHLTAHGTTDKKDPAWSTVYKYITSFGSDLVAGASDIEFSHLDADEYLDLYQGVIDRKTATIAKELAARELAGFHTYLHEHYGFEAVDFADLEGVVIAADHQVDADVVQPQEISRGLGVMTALALPAIHEQKNDAERTRLDRQALIFTLLLRASGARHNELTALRFKDILASPEFTLMFVRPSRYRRLKTAAARRTIDGSKRLSRRERHVVSDWLAAEKARLGKAWRSTLPIFGTESTPKVRVAPEALREKSVEALAAVMGSRSRVHRVRHLVACEDLAALWLSDQDWRALRHSRVKARRLASGHKCLDVALPRDIREQGVRFGHRRSSTTVLNYFHLPWMTKSRAAASLHPYETRHAAAVALGISVAGADKILQRKKSSPERKPPANPISAWVMHAAGEQTPTPGSALVQRPSAPSTEAAIPASARLVDRMLRDIQRGLSPAQAALAYGLNQLQMDRLTQAIREIEKRTAFRLMPHSDRKKRARAARAFEATRPAERIFGLLDEGSMEEQALVRDLSNCHLLWACRSKRDEFVWPIREVERIANLLRSAGVEESQIRRSAVAGEPGFEQLVVLRHVGKSVTMNHAIAWALTVVHATSMMR